MQLQRLARRFNAGIQILGGLVQYLCSENECTVQSECAVESPKHALQLFVHTCGMNTVVRMA